MKAMRCRATHVLDQLTEQNRPHQSGAAQSKAHVRTPADGEWVSGHPPRPEQDGTKGEIP